MTGVQTCALPILWKVLKLTKEIITHFSPICYYKFQAFSLDYAGKSIFHVSRVREAEQKIKPVCHSRHFWFSWNCRYDVRFQSLLNSGRPSYKTFERFINEELSMNIEELLKKLNLYIMNRIYICKDILYIDGTKFQAYAYQDMIKMNWDNVENL